MIPPAAAAGSPPASATAMPNRTRAATETAPTVPTTSDTAARIPVSIRGLGRAGAAALPASAITAASASVAESSHLDEASGDPRPRSDLLVTEKPDPDGQQVAAQSRQGEGGPATATSLLCVTSAPTARTNATMNWTRNSQPMVGIDRYPVR